MSSLAFTAWWPMAAAPCNVPTTTRRSRPIVAPPQPSYLRAGASEALGEGWAGGTIGPFGSEVFALPNGSGTLRLDIPAAAPTAGVIGRSVEGPGGAGRAAIATQNLALEGPRERDFAWDSKRPARTDFTVSVPEPAAGTNSARIRLTVQRNADRVGDAVQINLPIRPDRPVVHRRDLLAVDASGRLDFSALADPTRPASLARTVTLASDPAVVKLIAGANALTRPAVGGTTTTLRTRMRATIPGSFTAPPAQAEMLYRLGISDSSAGARVVVAK